MAHRLRSDRGIGILLAALMACGAGLGSQSAPSDPAAALFETLEKPDATPQARRSAASRLLGEPSAETHTRLVDLLTGANLPARLAILESLGAAPRRLSAEYAHFLLALLDDPEAAVRSTSAAALAGAGATFLDQIRAVALDENRSLRARQAAVESLGWMGRRDAVATILEAAQDPRLEAAALDALERATTLRLTSAAAASAWWAEAGALDAAPWQDQQIERLMRDRRAASRSLDTLEAQLASALRERFFLTAEPERDPLLRSFLASDLARVTMLGLELAGARLAEGKELSPESADRVRTLLTAPRPSVRAAAATTVARLRDGADEPLFVELLARETAQEPRRALVNGLGYVGSQAAARALLAALCDYDSATNDEAILALGRLAERGVLGAATRSQVTAVLMERLAGAAPNAAATLERLLWALSRMADPAAAPAFLRAIASAEEASVRLAAARGLAALIEARVANAGESADGALDLATCCDALIDRVDDPDGDVRRTVLEALAKLPPSDARLEALWSRLDEAAEPDVQARGIAWRGVLAALQEEPLAALEPWLERMAPGPASDARRAELLEAVDRRFAEPADPRERARIRLDLARTRARLGRAADALVMFLGALEDLHVLAAEGAVVPEIQAVSCEALRLALLNDLYQKPLASVFRAANPTLAGAQVWAELRPMIVERLAPETVDQAVRMLTGLIEAPPAVWPEEAATEIADLLGRARQAQAQADAAQVAAALARLRAGADDEAARQSIIELGPRAAPALRKSLYQLLTSEGRDPETERRLHDLLRQVDPQWAGFPAEATQKEKLLALEQAS